jgi:hypothetical protein
MPELVPVYESPLGTGRKIATRNGGLGTDGVGAPDTATASLIIFSYFLSHRLRPTPRRPAQDDCEPVEYVRRSRPHSSRTQQQSATVNSRYDTRGDSVAAAMKY